MNELRDDELVAVGRRTEGEQIIERLAQATLIGLLVGFFGKDTLIVGGDGTACRSIDGGKTFSDSKMGGEVTSFAHFTGSEFVARGRTDKNVMYKSADGATWTVAPTSHSIGASARSDAGTFVASNTGWLAWYEKQAFYRSKDGVTWESLPKTAFTGSHPIRGMTFGWLDPAACK